MFFRQVKTKRNGKNYTYVKLIENYREDGKIKQKVIANLGNIEHLNNDKINSLISSLNKLTEPCNIKKTPLQQNPVQGLCWKKLNQLWQELCMNDFLNKELPENSPALASSLIKTMIYQKLIHPNDNRPITISYPELNILELMNHKIPDIDFYQSTIALSNIKNKLEEHLFNLLKIYLVDEPSLLYTYLLYSEYTGNECCINTMGTTYHVRPFKKYFYLLTHNISPGFPIGCSIYDKLPSIEDIITTNHKISQNLQPYLVINGNETNFQSLDNNIEFIKSLPINELSKIPVSRGDLWSNKDAFTVNKTLWVKDIIKSNKRYIICHDIAPQAHSDGLLEQTLEKTESELSKIKSLVKENKLRREKTIHHKIKEILSNYNCQNYFNYQLNLSKKELTYCRNKEVIQKVKTLQRTWALETNHKEASTVDIINTFQECNSLKHNLEKISDITKIPVLYPYNDAHHCKEYVTGQVLIHLLCYTLKKLYSVKFE
ncbi:MAG: hypothetical protein K9L17_12285 [Clostridiales bacterium]|nr:hypothetical protein [Clostridiales bacterium]MCF8023460.1 hypothetical protein [Clostridiales bacterium]